jgi:hypothetical protein
VRASTWRRAGGLRVAVDDDHFEPAPYGRQGGRESDDAGAHDGQIEAL